MNTKDSLVKEDNVSALDELDTKIQDTIMGYPVKSTFKTAVLYKKWKGRDYYTDILDIQSIYTGNTADDRFKIDSVVFIDLLYAMIMTADDSYKEEEKYDEFLDSIELSQMALIMEPVLARTFGSMETDVRPQDRKPKTKGKSKKAR